MENDKFENGKFRNLKPFLSLPFKTKKYRISGGWFYSPNETIVKLLGKKHNRHFAIDYILPKGAPILAAAEGWAVSSFHRNVLRDPKDRRGFLRKSGKTFEAGEGNFVAIYHPKQKLFTQYSHLEKVGERIPFYKPKKGRGRVIPPVKKFLPPFFKRKNAVWVERGEIIGWAGRSGMNFSIPHLHFKVYRYRNKKGIIPRDSYLDPYDIYKTSRDYPWSSHPRPLGKKHLWLSLS